MNQKSAIIQTHRRTHARPHVRARAYTHTHPLTHKHYTRLPNCWSLYFYKWIGPAIIGSMPFFRTPRRLVYSASKSYFHYRGGGGYNACFRVSSAMPPKCRASHRCIVFSLSLPMGAFPFRPDPLFLRLMWPTTLYLFLHFLLAFFCCSESKFASLPPLPKSSCFTHCVQSRGIKNSLHAKNPKERETAKFFQLFGAKKYRCHLLRRSAKVFRKYLVVVREQ